MKRIIILIVLSTYYLPASSQTIRDKVDSIYSNFSLNFNSGDVVKAQNCLLEIIQLKDSVSNDYLVYIYNNIGVTSTLLGQYTQSYNYYSLGENLVDKNDTTSLILADIYINKARTYNLQKLFSFSIDYLEKGLRIYQQILKPDVKVQNRISAAYQNLGISYGGIKNYKTALSYFEKSAEIKRRYHLTNLGMSYLNIANTLVQLEKPEEAEEYFIKSISELKNESALEYQRISDIYFDYGVFLRKEGREMEAFELHKKALVICLKNFGAIHPYVSLAYKYIGDHYVIHNELNTALESYQNAIISLVPGFKEKDFTCNPPIDSVLLDLDLLKVLQKKSEVLEKLSIQKEDPKLKLEILSKSLETIELSLILINKIKNDYLSEESRLYLIDNEKETFIYATEINRNLFDLTHDTTYLKNMYRIARQAKSVLLQNEIAENELFYTIGISDSLVQKHTKILSDIAAYKKLIYDEANTSNPESSKVDIWKNLLFTLNREKEFLETSIYEQFPQFKEILHKTEPLSLEEVQSNLKQDETIVEYLFSNKYEDGKRKLFVFTITGNKLTYKEEVLDSSFLKSVQTISNNSNQLIVTSDPLIRYQKFTQALYSMYLCLIKPVEKDFTGKKLIIIPDEELSFLPFDAFIANQPDLAQINYEELNFLIKQYSFSYGYSSSLIFNNAKHKLSKNKVYAFSPDYIDSLENSREEGNFLKGTRMEIVEILKIYKGKGFIGGEATEHNFRILLEKPAIFHLAMHTFSDSVNSQYSCLIFNNQMDTIEDGNLHDFEIRLCRINSPMVVLSACKTGTGTLHRGEGVMSMTRAFILAGASSVVKTLWDVNDEESAKIVTSFYSYLSKGLEKDDALRMAKIDYLKNSSPRYSNPYYWASYQVVGDKTPIDIRNRNVIYISLLALLAIGGIVIFYFNRRRSSAA